MQRNPVPILDTQGIVLDADERQVAHLAGPAVQLHQRMVQRCCWCGHKLRDMDLKQFGRMIVYPTRIGFVQVGTIVRLYPDGELLPTGRDVMGQDSCLHLVELDG